MVASADYDRKEGNIYTVFAVVIVKFEKLPQDRKINKQKKD